MRKCEDGFPNKNRLTSARRLNAEDECEFEFADSVPPNDFWKYQVCWCSVC